MPGAGCIGLGPRLEPRLLGFEETANSCHRIIDTLGLMEAWTWAHESSLFLSSIYQSRRNATAGVLIRSTVLCFGPRGTARGVYDTPFRAYSHWDVF